VATLLISDLHLDPGRPAIIERFCRFIDDQARYSAGLYILGDLFEAWIGDDDDEPAYRPVVDALARLHAWQVPCFFMHGNRDFLIGAEFAAATGCVLLEEYAVIDLDGQRVLLTHGDLLCTDDHRYLQLRSLVRSAAWQRDFLRKPLAERRAIALGLRETSQSEVASKPASIMDVNAQTVMQCMRSFRVCTLLHGHTHRPAIHRFGLDDQAARRIVLGAWYEHGSVLRCADGEFELLALGD
jgi:UDP-2,3-diacylglucosamine hydrolase